MSNVFKGKALDDTRVSFAGVPLRVTGDPLQPDGETAVSIRQHQIELLATEPASEGQRGAGHGDRGRSFSDRAATIWSRSRTARSCAS